MKEERAAWLEKSRLGGIRSGQARKKAKETGDIEAKGGSSLVEDCFEPKGNTSTSTSTSIVTHTGEVPSKDEVVAYGEMIGLAAWEGRGLVVGHGNEGMAHGRNRGAELASWINPRQAVLGS